MPSRHPSPGRSLKTSLWALLLTLLLVGCASTSPSSSGRSTGSTAAVVQGYEAAFNAHSPEQVGRWLHEELSWLAIDGDQVRVEARGRAAMLQWLHVYFAQLPDVRAQIETFHGDGRYVAVHECLSWRHEGQARQQCAHGTYEIDNGLIRRVWYWPVEG